MSRFDLYRTYDMRSIKKYNNNDNNNDDNNNNNNNSASKFIFVCVSGFILDSMCTAQWRIISLLWNVKEKWQNCSSKGFTGKMILLSVIKK